jgi:D-alanyl-D-alanine carboxypeptidase
MKYHVKNNTVIKRAASVLLALAVVLTSVMPMAASDTYAAAENGQTETKAADVSVATEAQSASEVKTATVISNCPAVYNKSLSETLEITADIEPAGGREVQLQRYNSADDTWSTVMTGSAELQDADDAKETGSETAKAAVNVRFAVPEKERSKTNSLWRIYVPATDDAAEAYSENIKVTTQNLENLKLSARTACIYRIDDKGEGSLIYSKKADMQHAQASTTKLMTAILLLESGKIDSTTTISNYAARTPYASGRLAAGDVYKNRDLLYAMLLPSSNDAATAVAEGVGGSEAGFVSMMNAKAEEMGLKNTHFRNPHGLDADGHYTTAYELAKLTAYAYTFPEIRECWATRYKTIKSVKRGRKWTCWSTNAIFSYISNFLGGKTGTESNAGCCFTGVYKYGGSTYVTVVLGSGYGFSRWSDTKKLHGYIRDYATTGY